AENTASSAVNAILSTCERLASLQEAKHGGLANWQYLFALSLSVPHGLMWLPSVHGRWLSARSARMSFVSRDAQSRCVVVQASDRFTVFSARFRLFCVANEDRKVCCRAVLFASHIAL